MNIYSGRAIWPLSRTDVETDNHPDLFSIGVSLGRIPRFTGHTRELYTVLPHVLTVATIMPAEWGLYGLLHDAPEACVADVPTPWKTEGARTLEKELYERIVRGYGLVWPIPEGVQAAVDKADLKALGAEAHVIGHPKASDWWPEYDEAAAELTAYHLRHVPQMMNAEVGGSIYEEAFASWADKIDPDLIADGDMLAAELGALEA